MTIILSMKNLKKQEGKNKYFNFDSLKTLQNFTHLISRNQISINF